MAADPHTNVAPYALDALDPQDEREFEQHLASCERCRDELAALRETAADLAYGAAGPAPPPELKLRILESAKAAASAAAAAIGAAQRRVAGSGITFGRSARARSRIFRFSSGGGAGPEAP